MNLRWKIAQKVELKWWQRYLKGKDRSTYLQWKKQYWQQLFAKTGVIVNGESKILDAGCGPAGIFLIFPQHDVTAIDPLLNQYEKQLPHFTMGDYTNVKFRQKTLETFSEPETYDVIFCLNAINHVGNIHRAMDQLIGALRPGGQLVLSIDAHNYTWLKQIFRLLPGDILHPQQYGLGEYRDMLEQRNCKVRQTFLQKKQRIFSYYVLIATK